MAAALLLSALASRADAIVMVDPGAVGGPSNAPLVNNQFFGGSQTTSFHFVFEDMKHVEATRWGWQLEPDLDPINLDLTFTYYLTDMFGNQIDGTRAGGSGEIPSDFINSSTPIIAHDVFIEITPNQNIFVEIYVDGIVGEWVPDVLPEPAAITLFGFGLAGLGLAALRRRKAI